MTSCRFVDKKQPRMLRTHLDDCTTNGCRGCEPCPEHHCEVCGREHTTVEGKGTDLTCTECLSETRGHLNTITNLAPRLVGEALHRGPDSTAAAYAGPAIDTYEGIEAWRNKTMSAFMGRIAALEEDDRHPLWVLGIWDDQVHRHLNQPNNDRFTIASAHDYLNDHLTRLAHDLTFPFAEMADDLKGCCTLLEQLLREGEQIEEGAPCMKCERPVIRTTDDKGREHFECTRCHRTITANEYRLAVKGAHIAHADRLNADDLAVRINVPASTIRRWASRTKTQASGEEPVTHEPLLRSCGRDSTGRKVYLVARAKEIRDSKLPKEMSA